MTLLFVSFLAGILTILAPCVLPLLPVIIGGSAGDLKRRSAPYIIVASLGVSVVVFTLLLKVSTAFVAIPQSAWNGISGGILAVFGLTMVFPALWEKVAERFQLGKGSHRLLAQGYKKKSVAGDVIIGAALGPVFSTCSPTYFVILATVIPESFALGFAYLLAYVVGMSAVLLLIAILGQKFIGKLSGVSDPRRWFKRGLGVLFLLVGVFIILGIDKKIESKILDSGILGPTEIENRLLESSSRANDSAEQKIAIDPNAEYAFERGGLRTNTAKASIPLEKILDGGPGKDGIPPLTNPKFTNTAEAGKFLKDTSDGILVAVGQTSRYYPYNILVWHEVVNDVISGKHLVVTFCPLCGSAIVFEAEVDGEAHEFGVSGKLYESNLLMYDKKTESLWSQILGEAVVGDETGKKLAIYPSQVLSFGEVKKKYPNAEVLSKDTGHHRDYNSSPYGDYGANDEIYFPISIRDTRLPAKEIMYIVNAGESSVAFRLKDLSGVKEAVVDAEGQKITAKLVDGEIEVRDSAGMLIPGYHAMWFSWAIHHQKNGVVWMK